MNVAGLLVALREVVKSRAYFNRLEILDQSATILKARFYISVDLFVQIYRNDQFETTSFVLIRDGQRIYARDQLGGVWHRHTVAAPQVHDTSAEGRQSVDLTQFLDEVETVLAKLDLP